MQQAKTGDMVKVHYTGKLDDGTVFESTIGEEPLEVALGDRGLIAAFHKNVEGMGPGEKRTFVIPCEEAYGERHKDMVQKIDADQVPEGIEPELGLPLEVLLEDGAKMAFVITGIHDDEIILDANHPLAGENLNFEVELVEIN